MPIPNKVVKEFNALRDPLLRLQKTVNSVKAHFLDLALHEQISLEWTDELDRLLRECQDKASAARSIGFEMSRKLRGKKQVRFSKAKLQPLYKKES